MGLWLAEAMVPTLNSLAAEPLPPLMQFKQLLKAVAR